MKQTIAQICDRLLALLDSYSWLGPLMLRIFFGYFWFETGLAKLQNHAAFAERFMGWGVPFPSFSAALSGATDLVGGALLIVGLFTRLASIPMIINMVVAIALVVIKNVSTFDEFVELDEFVYILILFWLLMAGPGKASMDTLLARWLGLHRPTQV
ncbi:MAG: DoxX family protein [Gammaproteobacteria bacterium]